MPLSPSRSSHPPSPPPLPSSSLRVLPLFSYRRHPLLPTPTPSGPPLAPGGHPFHVASPPRTARGAPWGGGHVPWGEEDGGGEGGRRDLLERRGQQRGTRFRAERGGGVALGREPVGPRGPPSARAPRWSFPPVLDDVRRSTPHHLLLTSRPRSCAHSSFPLLLPVVLFPTNRTIPYNPYTP